MLFDDRLATVLRFPAQSELGARTQFRQLLDLLGSLPVDMPSELSNSAYARLNDLAAEIAPGVQSEILRAPGLRLRNRDLVARLARSEPQAAAAAMATAQLCDDEWVHLIPRLPLTARGFLRHRRDLPPRARQVLDQLGIGDLALPRPDNPIEELQAATAPARTLEREERRQAPEVGALVRRIEAFQQSRRQNPLHPRQPQNDNRESERECRHGRAFDFSTDTRGIVTWADPATAPVFVGLELGRGGPGALAMLDETGVRAMERRLPLRGARLTLSGVAEVDGEWRIDAAPDFATETGQFIGYNGRLRRPAMAEPVAPPKNAGSSDRMRQLLHELRTPVNAIQGFAEMIQQQMFGPAPNEYRALAAAIAVDAARLMAGFEEIDRLVRLESGALELGAGRCDLREIASQLLRRLESVLKPRSARIDLVLEGANFSLGLDPANVTQLVWRLLATAAGAMAPGEIIDLILHRTEDELSMSIELPGSMRSDGDIFAATAASQSRTITAGMFGSGFTLRLARAEARAWGGGLDRDHDSLTLNLPALTSSRETSDRHKEGG